MGDKSKIQWTDATWNPVTGCTRVSEGCRFCYAERLSARLARIPSAETRYGASVTIEGMWSGNITLVEAALDVPMRWKRPRRIFVNSMSDLFHPGVPVEYIDRVFGVMARCQQHTFQVLTKRPKRMLDYLQEFKYNPEAAWRFEKVNGAGASAPIHAGAMRLRQGIPLRNVWLGVSVEDQKAADERIPLLLGCPAAVRFLSCEPLLGPVVIRRKAQDENEMVRAAAMGTLDEYARPVERGIHWVIVGGESGPGARPMHPDWVRILRDQCSAANVPFFFKQWGEWAPDCLCGRRPDGYPCATTPRPFRGRLGVMFRCGKKAAGRELDGVEHSAFPLELRP